MTEQSGVINVLRYCIRHSKKKKKHPRLQTSYLKWQTHDLCRTDHESWLIPGFVVTGSPILFDYIEFWSNIWLALSYGCSLHVHCTCTSSWLHLCLPINKAVPTLEFRNSCLKIVLVVTWRSQFRRLIRIVSRHVQPYYDCIKNLNHIKP